MNVADWDKTLDLNLRAVFLCAQAQGKIMLAAGYGKIINTASMSGSIVNAPQHQLAYNASKAGVLHLTRSLAAEWGARGVRVNSISPGYTRTKLLEDHGKPRGATHGDHVDITHSDEAHGRGHRFARRRRVSRFSGVGLHDGERFGLDGGYSCW